MKAYKAKYPVREWLGAFESWVLVMHTSLKFRNYDRVLESFFSMFPKKTGIEQFYSTDVSDYKTFRLGKGVDPFTVHIELSMIHKFWNWLIVDRGLHVSNPARAFRNLELHPGLRTNYDPSLTDINRLLSECSSVEDKRAVLVIVQGGECPRREAQRRRIREAALRAGLVNFKLSKLKALGTRRLAREIIESYCNQVSQTFPPEAQLQSNPLAAIKTPPFDVRPPISNCNYDRMIVRGVD